MRDAFGVSKGAGEGARALKLVPKVKTWSAASDMAKDRAIAAQRARQAMKNSVNKRRRRG